MARLLEWPKSRTPAAENAGKVWSDKNSRFFAGGNVKWYGHFGRQRGIFLQNQTYASHTIQPSCFLAFPQRC